jgi:hypothetical protein
MKPTNPTNTTETTREPAHTPGLWNREFDSYVVRDRHGARIAIVDSLFRDQPQAIANARLIAAAPELLAALQSCQMAIMGYTHQNDITRNALNFAQAAIAKARGNMGGDL